MKNEMKAGLLCFAWLVAYIISLLSGDMTVLTVATLIAIIVLIASAKIEKLEKRLRRYINDANMRIRKEVGDNRSGKNL